MEIIVCDDGSTDDSERIVANIKNDIVRWLPGSRSGGPAGPRNAGIDASKGDWIAFLDNDDEWLENKLELQLNAMVETQCFACSTNAFRRVEGVIKSELLLSRGQEPITILDLLRMNEVVCSSMIVLGSVLNRAGRFNTSPKLRAYEDYDYWLRVSQFTDIAFVQEPVVIYSDMPQISIRSKGIEYSQAVSIIRKNIKSQLLLHAYRRRAIKALRVVLREELVSHWSAMRRKARRIAKRVLALVTSTK